MLFKATRSSLCCEVPMISISTQVKKRSSYSKKMVMVRSSSEWASEKLSLATLRITIPMKCIERKMCLILAEWAAAEGKTSKRLKMMLKVP